MEKDLNEEKQEYDGLVRYADQITPTMDTDFNYLKCIITME